MLSAAFYFAFEAFACVVVVSLDFNMKLPVGIRTVARKLEPARGYLPMLLYPVHDTGTVCNQETVDLSHVDS